MGSNQLPTHFDVLRQYVYLNDISRYKKLKLKF